MFKGAAHIFHTYLHLYTFTSSFACVRVCVCLSWHVNKGDILNAKGCLAKKERKKKRKSCKKSVCNNNKCTFIRFRLGWRQVGNVIYVLHTLIIRPVWHLVNAIVLLEIVATLKYLAQRWIVWTCANYVRAFAKGTLHWQKNARELVPKKKKI